MSSLETEEIIVEGAIEETQEATGTVTATEFQNQVEQRVEATTSTLQNEFGDAADDLIGDVTITMSTWKQSMNDLVGPDSVGDTEEEGAAAYVERASKKKVTSKQATDLHVEDRPYWERVKEHEEVHQFDQATDYSAQTVTYMDDSNQMQEVTVVGDLTEWQAITVPDQPDSDLTTGYIEHKANGNAVAEIAGEGAVTSTLASGDVESLQRTIIEKQHDQMVELVLAGESLTDES
ncbi:MAG: hypothetical protein HOG89_02430 [Candidatus Peribacter sp.]|jgi:hypothetical protein|nr:hypothetical protein [Candidatus Peribacter sp.]MBT4393309.1 hypothetical protein [Candidatus Peribacter sp.]MBT4600935.1 hypothetical protein [Candidatus Peribacter sp.]MBT5148836.1 hypothetical protein [Candidatus Peribacter sp.]MBT5637920.1 hypothetical protein [Candidatus Peribacter sp.]